MKLKLQRIACACTDRGINRPCRDDVRITTDDREAALADRTVAGVHWVVPADQSIAYVEMHDRPLLLQALHAEGYEVDDSEYTLESAT